jgi:hypothetical protein
MTNLIGVERQEDVMAINRYREPTSLFGLQRLNRILDEAFSGLPFGIPGEQCAHDPG